MHMVLGVVGVVSTYGLYFIMERAFHFDCVYIFVYRIFDPTVVPSNRKLHFSEYLSY